MYCTLPKTITIVINRNRDSFGYSTVLYCTRKANASECTILYQKFVFDMKYHIFCPGAPLAIRPD